MKAQDILILLYLLQSADEMVTMPLISRGTGISLSETHSAIKRLINSRLLLGDYTPITAAAKEFLIHGFKYVFPPAFGQMERGIPTSFAAPVFENRIVYSNDDVFVWPHPDGEIRGTSLIPFYKSIPVIALKNSNLYDYCALLDAQRTGRIREREIAEKMLISMIGDGRS